MSKVYRVALTRYVAEEVEILVRADSPEEIQAATVAMGGEDSPLVVHADNTGSWNGETTDLEVGVSAPLDESSIPHLDRLPVLDLTKA